MTWFLQSRIQYSYTRECNVQPEKNVNSKRMSHIRAVAPHVLALRCILVWHAHVSSPGTPWNAPFYFAKRDRMCLHFFSRSFFFVWSAAFSQCLCLIMCNWIWFCKRQHGSLNANIFASFSFFCSTKENGRLREGKKTHTQTHNIQRKIIIFLQLLCFAHSFRLQKMEVAVRKRREKKHREKRICKDEKVGAFFCRFTTIFFASWDYLQQWWFRVTVVPNCLC